MVSTLIERRYKFANHRQPLRGKCYCWRLIRRRRNFLVSPGWMGTLRSWRWKPLRMPVWSACGVSTKLVQGPVTMLVVNSPDTVSLLSPNRTMAESEACVPFTVRKGGSPEAPGAAPPIA